MSQPKRVYEPEPVEEAEYVVPPEDSSVELEMDGTSRAATWVAKPMELAPGERAEYLHTSPPILRERMARMWREELGELVELLPLELPGEPSGS